MADIRALRGVHYNKTLVKDYASVICPPYDIISPQQQQELYNKGDYNFVRLEYALDSPQDKTNYDKYARAAATLEEWLNKGILQADETPAIYVHDHHFKYQGKSYMRRGLTVRVRLEEWEKGIVRPHEGTIAEAKTDRMNLLWALQANTSPILALFEDRSKGIASVLAGQSEKQSFIAAENVDGESHDVWAITEPNAIDQISRALAKQSLYIADGHHRYESALAYKRERLACSPSATGEEAFNFVMMTLVDFTDPGLLILPPHRLVRGITKATLSDLRGKLEQFFEVEALPVDISNNTQNIDGLLKDETLIVFGLTSGSVLRLKLRDTAAVSEMMPQFHSDLYQKLDASIVDHVILENLLGITREKEKLHLDFTHDSQDAINRVRNQEYQLAFLLRPIKAETIKAMADVGDKMPRKSTYFYPKAPAGLIFYRLV